MEQEIEKRLNEIEDKLDKVLSLLVHINEEVLDNL